MATIEKKGNYLHRILTGSWRFAVRQHIFCWDHVGHLLVLFVFVGILGIATLNLSIFSPMKRAFDDFSMTDVYYEIQRNSSVEIDTTIVLVDMTELRNRSDIAQIIQQIETCKPRVLVIDLLFEREGDDTMGNIDLINAVSEHSDNIVLSCKLTGYDPQTNSFQHRLCSFFEPFGTFHWAYGNVVQNQTGGCIRKYSLTQKYQSDDAYSLPYMAACMYQGIKPTKEPINERTIVYGNTDFPVISCHEVKRFSKLLKDKLVILGTISTEEDSHITPIGKMPGMKIQAYSAQSYLNHHDIIQMSKTTSILLALLLCYFCAWIGFKLLHMPQPICLYSMKLFYFLLAALLAWVSFICFVRFDYNINLLYPLLGVALVEESRIHYKWLIAMLQLHTKWKFPHRSIYHL